MFSDSDSEPKPGPSKPLEMPDKPPLKKLKVTLKRIDKINPKPKKTQRKKDKIYCPKGFKNTDAKGIDRGKQKAVKPKTMYGRDTFV